MFVHHHDCLRHVHDDDDDDDDQMMNLLIDELKLV